MWTVSKKKENIVSRSIAAKVQRSARDRVVCGKGPILDALIRWSNVPHFFSPMFQRGAVTWRERRARVFSKGTLHPAAINRLIVRPLTLVFFFFFSLSLGSVRG
jgi:hypothetical protein